MLNLVPYPSGNIQEFPEKFIMPDSLGIQLDGFESWCTAAFALRAGLKIGGDIWLKAEKDDRLPEEGYRLTVAKKHISIQASTDIGVIWGLTTVIGLMKDREVPCCAIEDAPKYIHRGVSLDCARHFFPAEEVKKIIEEISLAKLNVFHWHLSDDQAWRIESKKFPKLHATSPDFYSQDEIRDIVEFARIRGVEIIPEIEMPGHTTGILAAYPQLSCSQQEVQLATYGMIYPIILCAGKEETYTFLEDLLNEIIPLFPCKRIHIGGDEAPKSEWKKCPHCKKRMKGQGLTDYNELQGYFTARVTAILKRYGKTAICWNETLLASNISDDIQIQYWTLQYRNSMQKFVESGGKWIYSDMFEVYFDYPYSMSNLKKVYETEPHFGKKAFAKDSNLLGIEACLWTEHIEDAVRLENMLFPRIYALAEINWCGKQNYIDFRTRLKAFISTEFHKDICYTPENWWEPSGKKRRKEAVEYFVKVNSVPPEIKAQTMEAAMPNKEFAGSFIKKFFRPLDIPALLKALARSHSV